MVVAIPLLPYGLQIFRSSGDHCMRTIVWNAGTGFPRVVPKWVTLHINGSTHPPTYAHALLRCCCVGHGRVACFLRRPPPLFTVHTPFSLCVLRRLTEGAVSSAKTVRCSALDYLTQAMFQWSGTTFARWGPPMCPKHNA